MRILAIVIAAAFLALPASAPAPGLRDRRAAFGQSRTADYSAAKKKKKPKKEKVEYMRAAPMK